MRSSSMPEHETLANIGATRATLAASLATSLNAPIPDTRTGVYRF